MTKDKRERPIIIVGAGPCGLVAALTLKQKKIPFVILEKASRARLCSNAGSGFDLAETALHILMDRLKVPVEQILLYYAGMMFCTLEGDVFRDSPTLSAKNMIKGQEPPNGKHQENKLQMASCNRSKLQKVLLDQLFPTSEDEQGILMCGKGVESYAEDEASGQVVVTLSDQSTLTGRALLACDGVHSKIRACMHKDKDDPLNFCNTVCYWAKCPTPEGSEVRREVEKTQTYKDTAGVSVVLGTGTTKKPGIFFLGPGEGETMWGIFEHSKEAPQTSNDLTRRGGGILNEEDKKELIAKYSKGDRQWALLEKLMEATPADAITKTGLFDRKNLSLPYTSPGKLVALLGDAAHPQTPFLGQGVNMAITDAYVYACRIADAIKSPGGDSNIPVAIAECDTRARRGQAKELIVEARKRCDSSVSGHWFTVWMMKMLFKYTPMSWLEKDTLWGDASNKKMLEALQRSNHDSLRVQ